MPIATEINYTSDDRGDMIATSKATTMDSREIVRKLVNAVLIVSLFPCIIILAVIVILRPRVRNAYLPNLWCLLRNQPCLDVTKKELFLKLANLKSKDRLLRKEDSIRILEFGVDYGTSFKYYPKGTRLVAVEINRSSQPQLNDELKKFPDVQLEQLVDSSFHRMADVPDNSIDAAISNQVMCSMQDPRTALSELKRVLVKGGHLFFIEHVPFPDGTWSNRLQVLFDPFWQIFAGCSLLNEFYVHLMPMGFIDVTTHYREYDTPFFLSRPHVYGIAVK